MKPTPRNSPDQHAPRRFPLTDYAFQATAEARTSASSIPAPTRPLGFHRLSSNFFAVEGNRHFIAELSFFSLITGISAWPIISALIAVVRLARNY